MHIAANLYTAPANRETKRQPCWWLLLAAVGIGCSGSTGAAAHSTQPDAATKGSTTQLDAATKGSTTQPDAATKGSTTRLDAATQLDAATKGSTTQLDAATKGSIIQPTQPDAAFDFSGPDIIQFDNAVHQGTPGPPRTFDAGCDQCPAFCDRDRCVNMGRGGIGYLGGMLGWECVERSDPAAGGIDPKDVAQCGKFLCMNHVCVSCRTDAECCPTPNDGSCHTLCQWLDTVGSNMCGL